MVRTEIPLCLFKHKYAYESNVYVEWWYWFKWNRSVRLSRNQISCVWIKKKTKHKRHKQQNLCLILLNTSFFWSYSNWLWSQNPTKIQNLSSFGACISEIWHASIRFIFAVIVNCNFHRHRWSIVAVCETAKIATNASIRTLW